VVVVRTHVRERVLISVQSNAGQATCRVQRSAEDAGLSTRINAAIFISQTNHH